MKAEKPKPKPKEYIDATELSSLLKCVLDYQFRGQKAGGRRQEDGDVVIEENGKKQDQEKENKADNDAKSQTSTAKSEDPLKNDQNKQFSLQFLTNFAMKGYSGDNRYDITDAGLPLSDKNNLKFAGVVTENLDGKIEEQPVSESARRPRNIELYKQLFSSFRLNFQLLAYKKMKHESGDSLEVLPAQFQVKFKFYNFDWTQSDVLFLDPLAPRNSPLIPILQQTKRVQTSHCNFRFDIDTDTDSKNETDRFIDYMFSQKLRLYFMSSQSELLFAACDIDLEQVLTCTEQQEMFQVGLYPCQSYDQSLDGSEPFGFIQFATGTYCEPLVDPYKL